MFMAKKYSKHIAGFLVTAGILFAGSQTADATVIYEQPFMTPGNAFWPQGNAIGSGKLKVYP